MTTFERERPRTRPWTRREYHLAAEVGVFGPEERLELLNGEVIQKRCPQGYPHAVSVGLTGEVMRSAFAEGFYVSEEKPARLSDASEPEPDVAVVRGRIGQLPDHPTPADIVLLIEVSDSTLHFDQTEKAEAYARSGIADYWLVNLRARQLEVRRDPEIAADGKAVYRTWLILEEGDRIAPLAKPEANIAVADLLPAPPTPAV